MRGSNCGSRRFTATACTATSPRWPSSTRWTRASSPSRRRAWSRPTAKARPRRWCGSRDRRRSRRSSSPTRQTSQLTGWTESELRRRAGRRPSSASWASSLRGLCSDAAFLRRAFLDAIGEIPSIEETRSLPRVEGPGQATAHLVDRLLGFTGDPKLDTYNDAYAAWWTLKWSDLIRNQSNDLGEQGMWAFHNWLSESFRSNKPFDQLRAGAGHGQGIDLHGRAGQLLPHQQPIRPTAPRRRPSSSSASACSCARCHHHPFEKYGQDDYYSFAVVFRPRGGASRARSSDCSAASRW